jgi:hypothetical protein
MQDVIGASAKICEERGGRRLEAYHLYVCGLIYFNKGDLKRVPIASRQSRTRRRLTFSRRLSEQLQIRRMEVLFLNKSSLNPRQRARRNLESESQRWPRSSALPSDPVAFQTVQSNLIQL